MTPTAWASAASAAVGIGLLGGYAALWPLWRRVRRTRWAKRLRRDAALAADRALGAAARRNRY